MIGAAMYTTIKTLREPGKNKSEIARLTGHDWKTVSKIIGRIEVGVEGPVIKQRGSILDPYRERIVKMFEEIIWLNEFGSLEEAKGKIGGWIESDYNKLYVHNELRYLSPEEFEELYHSRISLKEAA